MNEKRSERWRTGLTLLLWTGVTLSILPLVSRPGRTRRSVPGADAWHLGEPFDMPKIGSLAPDITLFNRQGWRCPLSAFRGRRLLLSFFRGDTPDSHLAREWESIHRNFPQVVILSISVSPHLFGPNDHSTKQRQPVEYLRTAVVDETGKVIYVSREQDNLSAVICQLYVTGRAARPR